MTGGRGDGETGGKAKSAIRTTNHTNHTKYSIPKPIIYAD